MRQFDHDHIVSTVSLIWVLDINREKLVSSVAPNVPMDQQGPSCRADAPNKHDRLRRLFWLAVSLRRAWCVVGILDWKDSTYKDV